MKASFFLWFFTIVCFVLSGMMVLMVVFMFTAQYGPGVSFNVPFGGTITQSSSPAVKATAIGVAIIYVAISLAFACVGGWVASRVRRGNRRAAWTGMIWSGLILLVMGDNFVRAMLGESPWFAPETSPTGILVNWVARGLFFGALLATLLLIERWLWLSRLYVGEK